MRGAIAAFVLVLGLLAAACVQGSLFHSSPSGSPEERFNDRWVGRSEDDVMVQYGKPEVVLELSTGNHVVSYHREIAVSSSRGGGFANQYVASSSSRSDSSTIDCDRRFEIDKQTLRVVRAVITGSSCDFSR
jgi:hypothetical protein